MEERKMTSKDLARKCAEYFKSVMKEEEFDTFEEMRQCYMWDTADIKEEVKAVIAEFGWFFTDDESEIFKVGDESHDITYKKFSGMMYSMIK